MSGRTKEELARKKAQEQNAKAKKKKTAQKKKAEGKSLGLSLPMVERKLPTLSKQDQKSVLERVTANRKNEKKAERKENSVQRYNPLIKAPTRMVADSSPEIDNLAEATVRKMAQGFEGALVGYSDRRNMKRAEDYLSGEYNNRVNPFTRTGMRMKVDDPNQVAKAKAEAERMGYKDLDRYEKAKANELIHANDDFYQRKAVLDKRVELENYQGIKKYIPELAEQIGSLVPTMAVGAVSGGIGSAAGLSGAALWAFNTLMTGGEIAGRVSGQEAKQVYDYLKTQNGNAMNRERMVEAIKTANTTGELVGIAEAGTEALFGGLPFIGKGILDTAAKKVGWEVLSPATKESIKAWRNTTSGRILTAVAERTGGALGEGVEEAVMTLAQPAIEGKVAGMESEVTLNDIIRDFGMGAAVSLVLGVPVTLAETTSALANAKSEKDAKNEILAAFTERNNELVAEGKMTPEQAKATVQEVQNVLNGKGSLRVSDVNRESKTESDSKEVYATVQDAKAALKRQAKEKQVGEEVSVAVVENGVPETWTAKVTENGIGGMQMVPPTREEQQAYIAKSRKMETAANEAERSGIQHNVKEEIVKEVSELSNVLGKEVEFFSANANVHGYVENGKIYVNANSSQSPAAAVIAHEMTHLLEGTKGYNEVVRMIWDNYGSSLQAKKDEIRDNYAAAGKDLNETDLEYELVAMFVEEKLLTDSDTIRQLATKDRSVVQKIVDWINNLIQKITGTKEQRVLLDARKKWMAALGENKKAPVDGAGMRYAVSKKESKEDEISFVSELEAWNSENRPDGDTFILGSTGEVLQGLGAIESDIFMRSEKINTIFKEHPEMSLFEIKKIPQILNDPILILKSRNVNRENKQNSRLILFGSVKARNGKPVLVAMDLKPVEKHLQITDMQKVTSAYTKTTSPVNFIKNSEFLYVHKNKKRAASLLRSIGFQMPIELQRVGSIGSISYNERSVNIKGVPFDEVLNTSGKTFSIGPSEDAAYMDAVNRGDMAEAQRMVDEAAEVALANSKIRDEEVNRWVAKTMQKEARNYTVGSVVELDGQRGTVSERKTKGRSVSYVIALDNGETRENVKPEELTVAVTPDLYFDELPEYQQNAWQEPPKGWDVSRDLADVAPVAIDMKEYREILYENGITVGVRKLNDWFKRNGWLKKIDRHYFPTEKSLKEGYFQRERYGNKITAEGQRYFLDLFTRNVDAFIDPEDGNDLVLPGNKPAKDSPTEERDYLEMLYEYENEIVDTGQDYSWAEALTGKGVTYSKDYARNFDAAAKHNPTLRNHLQQLFVRPLENAKADYAKAVRSRLTEMHDKMRELGIKKDTKASQAVQWIGEGFYQDKFGETHEYTIEMLKEEFPETWENIRDAATYFRHLYDEYLGEINAARELIYPHPLEDAQDQVAAYMLRRDRATDKIIELRATISELETVIAAKKAEYDGADAELQRSIRYNEDRLNKAKISLGDYISRRSKYIEKIKQIQADIDSGDILRNKRIVPRKDYFHHFQEMSDSLGDVFALSRNSAEIDPRLEGTSGYTEPKSKFSGITLRRNHGRYKADAVEGFVRYAQVAEYMKHIDPVISQFRSHIAGMANATKDSRNANKLIRWLVQWTNDLAGKTNPADRFLQDVIGREAVQFARKINSRAKANAVVGNLNSATAQIFNLPNLVGHVKDPKAYVEGFADLCKFIVREKGARDLVKESGFLNERYLDDVITSFDEKAIKKPERVAAWTLTVGDRYSTALIWFVAHHEAVNKGIVNPVEYADDITRRCVAGRGIGEIPITQKSNITQIFAPFQIEVNNAWQLYKEKIAGVKTANTKKEKTISFMQFLCIIIANFMLNTVTDLLIHRRVTFDPIYVLFQCIADWMSEDEEEETNWAERFVELMGRESGEIISNMPYGSLIAYYAFNNQWARENLFGDQDPTRFGVGNTAMEWAVGFVDSLATGKDVVDDAVGFLTTFVMPFGGKQAERSLQALVDTGVLPQVKWGWKEGLTLGRVDAPGSYSKNGEYQFPLHTAKTDFGQWITNLFFGKYATDSGQKYLGKDYENGTFWQNVFGFNKTKERKALSERATAVMKDLAKSGADVFEVYDTIRAIQDAEDTYGKNNVLRYSELTQDEKVKIILGYMTQKDDIESTEKKINAVLGVGLTVDDYLDIRNMYTIINKNEDLKSAGDKANQFVKELAAAGYTSEQIAGIYEGMSFWQSIPANIDKFTEMTSSGLDSETAILVQEAFDALEPLPGKTQVTALQKVEAIANLGLSSEKENLALSQAMGKEQYAKYTATTDYGVTAKTWVDFHNALAAADAANSDKSKRNGSYDKDEKAAALASMDISNEAKAALWQTLDTMIGSDKKTTEWKAARNPYSSKVGADIVEKYMEAKQSWTVKTPEASEDVSLNSMVAPLAGGGTITSGFGYRNTGIPGASTNHQAVDIAAPTGTDVGATIAGVVTRVSSSGGYGNSVEITSTDADGNTIVTKYSHLDNFGVAVGDSIVQGQKIGEVGNTGTGSGSHLDFKLGVNGEWVDPTQYLDLAAAGIVDGTNYAVREGTGGNAAVIYNASSGGGGSSGGGSSKKSYTSTGGTKVASVTTGKTGSTGSTGTSGGSSNGGGLSLPQASRPAVTGRSVDSPTYGTMGLTLPRANANRPTPTISTSVATTQRTGRTGGSLWDPDVLS